MAVALRGVAVFWGFGSGVTLSGTGIVTTNAVLNPQSIDFSTDSESAEIPNYSGSTVAKVWFNPKETMSITVIPTGTALADAKGASVVPAPGAVITVVDADDTEVAGATTTAWTLVRASKKRTNKSACEMTFELERFVENNLAAIPS